MRLVDRRLGHIRDTVQGVIDAQKAYQEAMMKGASLQRLEELAQIIAYVSSLIPVKDLQSLIDDLERKDAA